MGNTNTEWSKISDVAIVKQIGHYIKHTRIQQNKTQVQLAKLAGLNRWTIIQIERGESVTLTSLIQILRTLNCLHLLDAFQVSDEISPLEYARLKKKRRERVRHKKSNTSDKKDLGW